VALIVACVVAGVASASTFTVSNTNGSGPGSLADAVTQANAIPGPHLINITATGTTSLTTPLVLIQSMTINGPVATPPAFAIDGGYATRLIQVSPSAAGPMTLSYLTVTHGRVDSVKGGAIDVPAGQTLNVSNCLVTANATTGTSSADLLLAAGGAVKSLGTLNIQSSTFTDNAATGPGGAIYAGPGATLSVTSSLFTGNQAPGAWAGAILCDSTTMVTIIDSTFSFNRSGSGGAGALSFGNAKAIIRGSAFNGNTTLGAGGAMITNAAPGESIGIENSTFSGNTADFAGAFYAQAGTTDLRNVTITANSAKYGAGFNNPGAPTIRLRNTIVAGNISTQGNASDCSGPVASGGYNVIGNINGCTGLAPTDLAGVSPALSGLASNGGPTQTHLPFAGSPAIDGGNPSGCAGLSGLNLTVDQRGRPRPFGPRCDIGAVEVETSTPAHAKRRVAPHG
jgi:predicted outer membrane repeat protein